MMIIFAYVYIGLYHHELKNSFSILLQILARDDRKEKSLMNDLGYRAFINYCGDNSLEHSWKQNWHFIVIKLLK